METLTFLFFLAFTLLVGIMLGGYLAEERLKGGERNESK